MEGGCVPACHLSLGWSKCFALCCNGINQGKMPAWSQLGGQNIEESIKGVSAQRETTTAWMEHEK